MSTAFRVIVSVVEVEIERNGADEHTGNIGLSVVTRTVGEMRKWPIAEFDSPSDATSFAHRLRDSGDMSIRNSTRMDARPVFRSL